MVFWASSPAIGRHDMTLAVSYLGMRSQVRQAAIKALSVLNPVIKKYCSERC